VPPGEGSFKTPDKQWITIYYTILKAPIFAIKLDMLFNALG